MKELDEIAEARDVLNAETDTLNKTIGLVEVAIRDLRLGVVAHVPLKEDEEGTHTLSFQKLDKSWSLVVVVRGEAQALRTCSREVRLLAVPLIRKLVLAMAKSIDSESTAVRKATADLNDLLVELKS